MTQLKIAVTGAAGRMGRIYAPEFVKQGHDVRVFDLNRTALYGLYNGSEAKMLHTNRDLVKDADVVLLFTPVPQTEKVLKEMSKYMQENVILGSAASAKEIVAEYELKYAPQSARIVEFHPMHGENIKPEGQNLIIVPVRDFIYEGREAKDILADLFSPTKAKIRHIKSPKDHDTLMCEIQGGNHLLALNIATGWHLCDVDPDTICNNESPMYNAKSLYARRPISLNLEVYVTTILGNKNVAPYIEQYSDIFSDICEKVIEGEKKVLYDMFSGIKEHLGMDEIERVGKVWKSIYGDNFNGIQNSNLSLFAFRELQRIRGVKPTDFIDYESPHYFFSRMILYGSMNEDAHNVIDNAIHNPKIRLRDFNYARAFAIVNQIVQSGDEKTLLSHLYRLKKFYNSEKMQRNLDVVRRESINEADKFRR